MLQSNVFPTVGQVDCMEPVNGRRCAATYECGDQTGALWGDMASNDGSQAINAASPVATGRSCVVAVDSDYLRGRFGGILTLSPVELDHAVRRSPSLGLASPSRLGERI